eukprot:jgi/Botrbrau1/16828/Bobra.150_2s0052.2
MSPVLRRGEGGTASEPTNTEPAGSYASLGTNTELPRHSDACTQVRVLRPIPPNHPSGVRARLLSNEEAKIMQQISSKEKIQHRKEMQTTVKQIRLLKFELQKAQKQNNLLSVEYAAAKAALKKRDAEIACILADCARFKKEAADSITRSSEEIMILAGDVESWKSKHKDLESKYSLLSQRVDEVGEFEKLHHQKTQLEALLAAAVVRLEQSFNESYQATRYKDQCVGPASSQGTQLLQIVEKQVNSNELAIQSLRKALEARATDVKGALQP